MYGSFEVFSHYNTFLCTVVGKIYQKIYGIIFSCLTSRKHKRKPDISSIGIYIPVPERKWGKYFPAL